MSQADHPQNDWGNTVLELLPQVRQQLSGPITNQHDRDDLLQEVMIAALEGSKKFDTTKKNGGKTRAEKIASWLSGITKNKVKKYLREKAKNKKRFAPLPEDIAQTMEQPAFSPRPKIDKEELTEVIQEALKSCTKPLLDVAGLYFQGKSYGQIARILKIERDTAYTRAHRLRKKIRAAHQRLQSVERTRQIIHESRREFGKDLCTFIQRQKMEDCCFGEMNSFHRYAEFVDQLEHPDEQTRRALKTARRWIEAGEGLSLSDQKFLAQELNDMTRELDKIVPESRKIFRIWKHVREASAELAAHLLTAPAISQILKR